MRTQRISITQIIERIESNGTKFFTVTFQKKDNTMRTINCIRKKGATTRLGYLTVWSVQDRGYKNVDTRTITAVNIENQSYKIV